MDWSVSAFREGRHLMSPVFLLGSANLIESYLSISTDKDKPSPCQEDVPTICFNKTDLAERNSQVAMIMMRDAFESQTQK